MARSAPVSCTPTPEGEHVLDLRELGWDDGFAEQFAPYAAQGFVPGRVSIQHRGAYDVFTEHGEIRCDVRGRLFDEAESPADLPAVGDWVALSHSSRRANRDRRRAASAPLALLAKDGLAGNRGAGDRRERRRRLPHELAERRPQPPSTRALPDPRARERGPAGRRPHEGGPPSGSRRRRPPGARARRRHPRDRDLEP